MEKSSPMPTFYVQPYNTPLNWQNEQSGNLAEAVKAYFAHMTGEDTRFQGMQFALVRDYLRYYINAPCWQSEGNEIDELRKSVTGLKTPEEMREWIMKCVHLGIDPF